MKEQAYGHKQYWTPAKTYHHIAGVDFNHCEKGKCVNCTEAQQRKCEKEVDNIRHTTN